MTHPLDRTARMPQVGQTFETSTVGPRKWRIRAFSSGRTRTALTARLTHEGGRVAPGAIVHTFELVPNSRDARGICTYHCAALGCSVYL